MLASDLDIKEVTVEAIRFYLQTVIDRRALPVDMSQIKVSVLLEEVSKDLILRLVHDVYGRQVSDHVRAIRHIETDWWQALKQRWFPRWAKCRWRVEWEEIETRIDEYHLCPHISVKDPTMCFRWLSGWNGEEYERPF